MLGLDIGCCFIFVASLIGLEALWRLMQIFGVYCLKTLFVDMIFSLLKKDDVNNFCKVLY